VVEEMRAGSFSSKAVRNETSKTGTVQHTAAELVTGSEAQVSEAPLRILIADDQSLVRAGICELMKLVPNVEVVVQANDGSDALRLAGSLRPDLILMDLAMPGMNGLEATSLAKQAFPNVKIIVLSDQASEQVLFRALRLGAEGFLLKDDSVEELRAAIRAVSEGARYISPNVRKKNLITQLNASKDEHNQVKLTGRQRVVLKLIAEGKSTKEIANLLNISVNTAKTHRLKLMERLGVHEVAGVVRQAVKMGLVKS
jgi:DNA-binding NarL/FixJ family response regulator